MADVEKLLVVGDGIREFAIIAEALAEGVPKVYSTRPEDAVNIGIEDVVNVGIGESIHKIGAFAVQEDIDFVIVGPEAPLIRGVGNVLRHKRIPVLGPNADGAQFERTKVFTEEFARRHGLPRPDDTRTFLNAGLFGERQSERGRAKDYIIERGPENVVTKRVGQEEGKGAKKYGTSELDAALREVDQVMWTFGEDLIIEGRLHGDEFSPTYLFDGQGNAVALALARDYKALRDISLGPSPNTGGMGAFSPLSMRQASLKRRRQMDDDMQVVAQGLKEDGIDYRGVVYPGYMAETKHPESPLRLIEINVRFGSPETNVILHSLGGRAIEYMYAAARGSLETDMSRLYRDMSGRNVLMTVVLASPGYAEGKLKTGLPIHLPKSLPDGVTIQFGGAKMVDGKPVTTGGRPVSITKHAETLAEAREVYDHIGLENGGLALGNDEQVVRTDIGLV